MDHTSDGLSNLLLSCCFNVEYNVWRKFWITSTYKHFLTPIYDKELRFGGDAKYRMVNLGLKYVL